MAKLRTTEERRSDVIAALGRNADLWLATASPSGQPHLIAVSAWWDGSQVVVATTGSSRSARNLEATGEGRLALGSPDDVVVIDVRSAPGIAVEEADPSLATGFVSAVGWNPAEVGRAWKFFRLEPVRIQAYRGYDELAGRDVMVDSKWLA
jgi:hypothetical protein